jgi:hypothetical protein
MGEMINLNLPQFTNLANHVEIRTFGTRLLLSFTLTFSVLVLPTPIHAFLYCYISDTTG